MRWTAVILGAYLLGSLSFSYLIVRRLQGRDVRTVGSGNPGATNVLRVAGRGAGLAVLFLDAGKGMVAVAVPRALEAPPEVIWAAAAAAVIGHVYPAFLGLRGGKGVATGVGVMLALAPLAALGAVGVFVAVVAATRYVALGSVAAAAACAPLAWAWGRLGWAEPPPPGLLATTAAIAGLIVLRHAENLRRIREGSEVQVGEDRGGEA